MMTTQSNPPAFRGAPFTSTGACTIHPDIQLSNKLKVNGRIVYQEVRKVCPKCQHHDDAASTSGSSVVKSDSRMNSMSSYKSARSNVSNTTGGMSRKSDGSGRDNNYGGGGGSSSVVKASHRRSSNVSSVSEGHQQQDSHHRSSSRSRPRSSSRSRGRDDERSSSNRARSKSRDRRRAASVGRNNGGGGGRCVVNKKKEYDSPFDSKGRCHYHSQVQLAKKKLMGGWNVLLDICPKCMEESYINDDNRSVASGRSCRSNRSHKSVGRVFTKNKVMVESPFDSNGYCHRHAHVRLAKKKTLGGWKIIQSFCPECAKEDAFDDNASAKSGRSRRSTHSKSSRYSKSSRRRSSRYEDNDDETDSAHSNSQEQQVRKKLVKKMKFRDDETGEDGLYTGYVNGDYQPHGRGKLVYPNGDRYEGTWCEGSKVHGKTTRAKKSNNSSNGRASEREYGRRNGDESSHDGSANNQSHNSQLSQSPKKQISMNEYRDMYSDAFSIPETKKVKDMRFVDYFGDPGRYTGEVNDVSMPHGLGEMTYDHGLVQGGNWTNGVLDEGSIVSSPKLTGAAPSRRNTGRRDP